MKTKRINQLTDQEFLGIINTSLFASLVQRKVQISASEIQVERFLNKLTENLEDTWYYCRVPPYNIENSYGILYVSTDSDLGRLKQLNEGN